MWLRVREKVIVDKVCRHCVTLLVEMKTRHEWTAHSLRPQTTDAVRPPTRRPRWCSLACSLAFRRRPTTSRHPALDPRAWRVGSSPTTSVVHVELSSRCVCVCVCVQPIIVKQNDIWRRYLAPRWFTLLPVIEYVRRSRSSVKVLLLLLLLFLVKMSTQRRVTSTREVTRGKLYSSPTAGMADGG